MTIYFEQNPEVFGMIDDPPKGSIRVKFHDITLAMNLTTASWLAANISREIRKLEQEHPEVCGISDAERLNLKCGDIVTVRDDAGREADYQVKHEPWKLGCGEMVIGLRGLTYGYALDRVVKIVRFADLRPNS